MEDGNILKQFNAAQDIKKRRLKIWYDKFKKYLPTYVAEYLFYKNGVISDMVNFDEIQGFVYDPETLAKGIDEVYSMLEAARNGNFKKAEANYLRLGEFKRRIDYYWRIIDQLDIYAAIGEIVVSDLKQFAKISDEPEFLEIVENRIRNVQRRAENEKLINKQPQ